MTNLPLGRLLFALFSAVLPVVLSAAFLAGFPVFAKSPEEFLGGSAGKPPPPAEKTAPAAAKRVSVNPAPGKTAAVQAPMDTAKLHAIYLEGDFDQAIRVMVGALKSKKTALTHADSVFIFKHLGVMYAATPATREKGRFYMAQLISVEPTAKILDMYASDMIYLIFRNVQEEFENSRTRLSRAAVPVADTAPVPVAAVPLPSPSASTPAARKGASKSQALYWATGGAVVAVGVVGLVYVLFNDPEPKQHQIHLQE